MAMIPRWRQGLFKINMRKNRIIWLLFVVMLVVCLLDSAMAADKNKERITGNDVKNDFQQFYSHNRLMQMGIAFGGGAVMANTSDKNLQNCYQSHIRNSDTDEFAKAAKVFGGRIYLIPLSLTAASAEYYFYSEDSRWNPLNDVNGVSGHAFIGAVPFLTIARMHEENSLIKYFFHTMSGLTAWARINDNNHFASQAALVWYMALEATDTIWDRDKEERKVTIIPSISHDRYGIRICLKW